MPIVRKRRDQADLSGVDWAKVRATTDEDIARMAAEDPDTPPPATDAELARARWVMPTPSVDDVRAIRRREARAAPDVVQVSAVPRAK